MKPSRVVVYSKMRYLYIVIQRLMKPDRVKVKLLNVKRVCTKIKIVIPFCP